MGRLPKGPFGPLSGKAGPLIGIISRGENFVSGLRTRSGKQPTQRQTDQRIRFGLVTHLLAYFSDLIEIGFQHHVVSESAMNAAVSYNLKYAVTDISPNFQIDLPKLTFSRGKLITPKSALTEAAAGAQLHISWTASPDTRKLTNPGDGLMLLVYNPQKNEFVSDISIVPRSALTYTAQLPADFVGDEIHTYLAFSGIEGNVSDSVYAGSVTVI